MGKRVLVVDADAEVRRRVRELLSPLEVEVTEADDADGLVRRVKRDKPEVVLLDLDGDTKAAFAAADALKDDPETGGVQVLALSGNLDSRRTAGATEHAFEDYMSKPIDPKELVPILRFHLDLPHGLNDAHPR